MARLIRYAVALVTAISIGSILSPAQAQATEAPPLTVEATAESCGATIIYTNTSDRHFWGDWKIDGLSVGILDADLPDLPADPAEFGDAHNHGVGKNQEFAGGKFGLQFNPVLLPPGRSVVINVQVPEVARVQARIWRGPETDWYVPWAKVPDVQPCSGPSVLFTDLCQGTTVHVANSEDAAAAAMFSFDPVVAGVGIIVAIEPGHQPDALIFPTDAGLITITEQVTGQVFTHTWTKPDDCEKPTPAPTPTVEPTTEPTEPPASGAGGGSGLPVTGGTTGILVGLGAMLLLGGGVALFVRGRRVSFTA